MSDNATHRARFVRAFLSSVLGTGLSRILGAIRDIAVAGFLGAGASSDAFWIAFTIPNVFRRFVADEGLTGALVPAVARAEAEEGREASAHLADQVLTGLLIANVVLCVAGIFGAEWLVKAFAWSFTEDPEKFALTVQLTRWLFPFVSFVSMVSLFEGLLNHRGHFFVPKVAPGLVSAGMVASIWGFGTAFARPVDALAAGTMVGGLIHVLVHLPVLDRYWGPVRPTLSLGGDRFRAVLVELSKVIAIGVFAQINILVLRQLAAAIGDGAITRYWYANRLVDLSQGVIAVAIGSALLPDISRSVAEQDWTRFRGDLVRALRLAMFLLLPAAAVLLAFAEPITAILFRQGAYTWQDVQWTALTLQFLTPFMLAVAGLNILKKVFFALDLRNDLLKLGGLGVTLTFALGWSLVRPYEVVGLAMALSGATCLQLVASAMVLQRRVGTHLGLVELVVPARQMGLATVPMLGVLWLASMAGDWSEGPRLLVNWLALCGGLLGAGSVYLGAAWALGITELTQVTSRVAARLRR